MRSARGDATPACVRVERAGLTARGRADAMGVTFGRVLRVAVDTATTVAIGYTLVAAVCVAAFGRRPPDESDVTPPVTLLVPLHGAEPGLEENLRAFASQDYPAYQLVFGVKSEDDGALPIARRIAAAHPDTRIDIAIGRAPDARNPKIANVMSMMRYAQHDVLVMADSDGRPEPWYLRRIVAPLQTPGVGLVTCLFSGNPDGAFASRIGAMFMNEHFIPSALVDRMLGPLQHGFGPTNAFRREVLAAIGGFEALAPHLADDFMLGHFIAARGQRVVLSRQIVRTMVSEAGLRALFVHELRWHRTIRSLQPAGYAGWFVTFPIPLALVALAIAPRRGGAALRLAAAFVARVVLQRVTAHALGVPPASIALIVPRDLFGIAVWARGLTGSGVRWRGDSLAMADGDTLA
jgi:ceramide glucosyltransferase